MAHIPIGIPLIGALAYWGLRQFFRAQRTASPILSELPELPELPDLPELLGLAERPQPGRVLPPKTVRAPERLPITARPPARSAAAPGSRDYLLSRTPPSGVPDRTAEMMIMMSGPGLCTPRRD